MPPAASKQSSTGCPLNDVFGSHGQVRLLRILATHSEGPLHSSELATLAGMTEQSARRGLDRLSRTGLVRRTENGRKNLYAFSRDAPLALEIERLFQVEGAGRGARKRSPDPVEPTAKSNGGESSRSPFGEEGRLNPASPEFSGALVALLEENLSVLRRARENVCGQLKAGANGDGPELWEWQKILDTFSLPKLLNFLDSDSPRAVRLRKCSPFPAVLSEEEQARLEELIGQPDQA